MLHTASEAIVQLKTGKASTDILSTEQSKAQFKKATQEYYTTLEDVTVSLRREIRLLSNVSKDKVLPISLVPKAEWVGKLKEAEVWKRVDEQLAQKEDNTGPANPTPTLPVEQSIAEPATLSNPTADEDVIMKD